MNNDSNRLQFLHWGLVPFWAKEPSIGSQMCNARAETVAEKGAFKHAFRRRRCLIPADGFYEWQKLDKKTKQPLFIHLKNRKPFCFAGLWETWHSPNGSELRSATVITTTPNELIAPIHDRMPVIIDKSNYPRWLDTAEKSAENLADLLKPFPAAEMDAYAISPQVNNVRNDAPTLIDRADPAPTTLFG